MSNNIVRIIRSDFNNFINAVIKTPSEFGVGITVNYYVSKSASVIARNCGRDTIMEYMFTAIDELNKSVDC